MASTAVQTQNTKVKIGGSGGSPQTISGVSVGNPTRLTVTATTLVNGDLITLSALTGADAAALNGKTYVVQYKTTNTIAVAQDTTGLTITAGSGAATPVTFTALKNVKGVNGFDGAANEINVTDFDSTSQEYRLGLQDAGNVTVELFDDGTDPGQVAVSAVQATAAITPFQVLLSNGGTLSFSAFVKKFSLTAAVDGVYSRALDLRISGPIVRA